MAHVVLGARTVVAVASPTELARYYEAVAPFYAAETALRADLPLWRAIVARAGARAIVDLGCGDGRAARALPPDLDVVGVDLLTSLLPPEPGFEFVQADMRDLPFVDRRFDLAIAANDPFAHLLGDDDRARALDEAQRVAGRIVVDGLAMSPIDDARAGSTGLVKEAALPGGVTRHETWHALGGHRYHATYRYLRDGAVLAEAAADVRAWSRDEPALRGRWPRLYGGLDGRPFDPDASAVVIAIGVAL